MTLKEKIKACVKIFHNKPIATITYGVRCVRCDECEYNLQCDNCFYKALYESKGNCGADMRGEK